jgi:D-glycero-D-manno-heptose 1,7-bisphosphate phosphatase
LGRPAVFLDRDDTLIHDKGYSRDPEEVELLPGVSEGLRQLIENRFVIVVITNQSGVGRGYLTKDDVQAVHEGLKRKLRDEGADYHAVYFCPHRPDEDCLCRKPRPGLILQAARDQELDLASSYTIGDKEWDVSAGMAAGTRTILLQRENPTNAGEVAGTQADFVANNLIDAAHLILSKESKVRGRTDDRPIRASRWKTS